MKKRKEIIMKINHLLLAGIGGILVMYSCNPTKYVADNEKLYKEGQVVIHNDTIPKDRKEQFEAHLHESLLPKPNAKFLGLYFKLGLWNMGKGPDSTNSFFNKWLKKVGEKPVLLSDVNREYNENLLRNKMENLGFFKAQVSSDTIIDGKYGIVRYDANPGKIYRINKVDFEIDTNTNLGKVVSSIKDQSLLKTGAN